MVSGRMGRVGWVGSGGSGGSGYGTEAAAGRGEGALQHKIKHSIIKKRTI